jgi:hypothetical protein
MTSSQHFSFSILLQNNSTFNQYGNHACNKQKDNQLSPFENLSIQPAYLNFQTQSIFSFHR